ncbi:polyprenol phosphomannose-dependent alpha 1,6 mannosyltransferase MptB [Actinoplanes sp. NPDC049802]|uniref:polyprenol phosphomannose-dependent alpha 1,6 mannosyltransferase MptB n=1 Tax=Actinoplanes sp. NPDC049802 TaxID=3154742 RepID=UPI0033D86F7D
MSSTVIRYLGLAGSVLLVIAGRLGGALPAADLGATPASVARGPYGPAILICWLVGTGLHAYAWWSGRDRNLSVRWVLVTAALWTLPFLAAPPMGSRDVYSYACQGQMFQYGADPYRHGVGALPCTWIDTVSTNWRDTVTPYGPLFILIAAAAVTVGGGLTGAILMFRLIALAGIVTVAVGLPTLARRCGVPPQRALWLALAGPLVGAHLLGAPHNDAIMLGAAVAALLLTVRARARALWLLAAGALLGLAISVKLTALVIVPFAVLAAGPPPTTNPATGWLAAVTAAARPLARPFTLVAGGVTAALTTVSLASGLGWGWIPATGVGASLVQFTSPPTAVGMTATYLGRTVHPGFDAVPVVRAVAVALLAATLVCLWWRAHRDPDRTRAALHGAALALAATVLFAPVLHPWYVLWPLTLLAATTVRTKPIMLVTVACAFSVLPDGGGLARFVKFPGAPLATVLLAVLLVVAVRRRTASAQPAASV